MAATPAGEAQIVAAYRALQKSMVGGDTRRLRQLLADGFTLRHMTGYVQPLGEWLAQIDSGQMRYFDSEEQDVSVLRVEPEHARLRGRNRVRAQIWGATGTWPLQLDIDFVRSGDQWLMLRAVATTY